MSKSDRESLRKHLSQSGASTLSAAVDALVCYRGPLKGTNPSGKISTAIAESIRHFVEAGTVADCIERLEAHFEGLQLDLGKAEDDIFFAEPPCFHNDGIWPNRNAQTPEEKEAERRVFYVAFTRARKRVIMLVNRRLGTRAAIPSPFINELGLSVS